MAVPVYAMVEHRSLRSEHASVTFILARLPCRPRETVSPDQNKGGAWSKRRSIEADFTGGAGAPGGLRVLIGAHISATSGIAGNGLSDQVCGPGYIRVGPNHD
nr:hypothetical protein CFP56_24610 [Quercus suber]